MPTKLAPDSDPGVGIQTFIPTSLTISDHFRRCDTVSEAGVQRFALEIRHFEKPLDSDFRRNDEIDGIFHF